MENKYIIHFAKLEVPQSDLDKLSVDEVAFIATMAFAVDELSVFNRLLLQTFNGKPSSDEMLGVYQTQQNALFRVLISKTFEALKIVESFKQKLQRGGISHRFEGLTEYEEILQDLKLDERCKLAKNIRDHSTNHYLPSVVASNLASMDSYPKFNAFIHKNSGNSYHPFGEEAVFLARMGRHFKEAGRDTWSIKDFRGLIDWTIEVSSVMMKIFQNYLLWLHKKEFPQWRLAPISPYLEPEFYARADEVDLPIFIATDHLSV